MHRIVSPHFCAAAIFSRDWDKVLGVLPKGWNKWKLPGGCGEIGETPEKTLEREIETEVSGISGLIWEEVYRQAAPNQGYIPDSHIQHFYLIKKWEGVVHTGWFMDDEEPKDLEWLEPLAFTSLLFHTHLPGWRKIVQNAAICLDGFLKKNHELVNRMQEH